MENQLYHTRGIDDAFLQEGIAAAESVLFPEEKIVNHELH
jgi:hypothetical protein